LLLLLILFLLRFFFLSFNDLFSPLSSLLNNIPFDNFLAFSDNFLEFIYSYILVFVSQIDCLHLVDKAEAHTKNPSLIDKHVPKIFNSELIIAQHIEILATVKQINNLVILNQRLTLVEQPINSSYA